MRDSASYEQPAIRDYGDLVALTAACLGAGTLDEALKADDDPFKGFEHLSPAFGDPAFCTP